MGLGQISVETRPGRPLFGGVLVYREGDHAFDFRPSDPGAAGSATTSLLIGTVQVEVDTQSGRLLFAWGYSPAQGWQRSSPFDPLSHKRGEAVLSGAAELRPGVSVPLVDASDVRRLVDPHAGVVRVVQPGVSLTRMFTIASGVGLLFAGPRLVGVQLSPSNFDDIPQWGRASGT